jgi:hypothetical protein
MSPNLCLTHHGESAVLLDIEGAQRIGDKQKLHNREVNSPTTLAGGRA